MKELLLFLLLLAPPAGLNGNWRAESVFPRGDKVIEFLELKSDGATLKGTFVDAFGGHHEIRDGKVRGESLSFWIPWEKDKCEVTGALRNDVLELKLVTPQATRSTTAKRAE